MAAKTANFTASTSEQFHRLLRQPISLSLYRPLQAVGEIVGVTPTVKLCTRRVHIEIGGLRHH